MTTRFVHAIVLLTDTTSHTQRKTFLYGERLVDRLDFEELALKSLDPSLAPKISNIVPGAQESEPQSTPVVRTSSRLLERRANVLTQNPIPIR